MKIEIRRGKRGESHKFMSKIGGEFSCAANTLDRLMHLLRIEVKLYFELEEMCAPRKKKTRAAGGAL